VRERNRRVREECARTSMRNGDKVR
jgi:hypothetical protein